MDVLLRSVTHLMLMVMVNSLLLSSCCQSSSVVVVDGYTTRLNKDSITVHIGDSIVFRHKYSYDLYIFRSKMAFDSCNFTQATLLTHATSSSYTWRPSRLGHYYFSLYNGTTNSCRNAKKVIITVAPQPTKTNTNSSSPAQAPAPTPETSSPASAPPPVPGREGGVVSSSPAYPWPFQPSSPKSPTSSPTSSAGAPLGLGSGATAPWVPDSSSRTGTGNSKAPFIDSDPAVPLPTNEVDSATIRPLPTPGADHDASINHSTRGAAFGFVLLLILAAF